MLSDEELVCLAKEKNEKASEILIRRYSKKISLQARKYYLIGYEEDDLMQEGYIALFSAIANYNGKSSFENFFNVCLKNKINTLAKRSINLKNKPLSNYISIDGYDDVDNDKNDLIMDSGLGPEEK